MLSAEQIDTFDRDGGVVVRNVIDVSWIEQLRELIPTYLETAYDPSPRLTGNPDAKGDTVQSDGMWRSNEFFKRFLLESGIAEVSAEVLRASSVQLYEDLLLYKPAGANGEGGWHRDSVYWPVTGRQMVNAWFSLEPTSIDSGTICFVPGTQDDDEPTAKAKIDQKDPGQGRSYTTTEVNPGDLVLFHPRMIHAGLGSDASRPRRTFTIRFMGDDVRWKLRSGYFHPWMADCGLQTGDRLDHPGFPVMWGASVPA